MDATKYGESNYVSKELILSSPSKQAVIISVAVDNGKYGERLIFDVEISAKNKKWNPNRTHVNAIIQAFGKETSNWIGKTVYFSIQNDKLIATPIIN